MDDRIDLKSRTKLLFRSIDTEVYRMLRRVSFRPDEYGGKCHQQDWIMLRMNEEYDYIHPFFLVIESCIHSLYRKVCIVWMDDNSKQHIDNFLERIQVELMKSRFHLHTKWKQHKADWMIRR